MSSVSARPTGYLLKQAQQVTRYALERALAEWNLSLAQYRVLDALAGQPGQSNADLARAAFIAAQSMHGVLAKLETAGLVERRADADGGRRQSVHLTAAGRALHLEASAPVAQIEAALDAAIAPLDRGAFRGALVRVREALSDT